MGRAGRAVAEGRTWEAVAEETMRVYREVLEKHQNGGPKS
jgi:hypothetical protein